MINIKYYKADFDGYYAASERNLAEIRGGDIQITVKNSDIPIIGVQEVYPPDPGPIEERYINATDSPSLEGKL